MAVVGTLTKSRKIREIIYMIASAATSLWFSYDGWISTKFKDEPGNLLFNKVAGIGLAVAFVVVVIRFLFIRKTRVVADDSGIDVNGRFKIAWSAITGLEDKNLAKGLLDIYYQAGDNEKKYTLDNYKITCFDEIVDQIGLHRPDLVEPEEASSESAGQTKPPGQE